jgi:hypothetical protein
MGLKISKSYKSNVGQMRFKPVSNGKWYGMEWNGIVQTYYIQSWCSIGHWGIISPSPVSNSSSSSTSIE